MRNRLLHHLIYQELYGYFDFKFIHDSYSCRVNKGTHKAINRFQDFSCKVSKNNTRSCLVLKCDIRKFFASIDHRILKEILSKTVFDKDKEYLKNILNEMKKFLESKLKLNLHPDKVSVKTVASGIDFLSWVHFPKHRVLRTATKLKMFKNIKNNQKLETVRSYLGLLKHGNTHKLKDKLIK